MAMNRRNLLMNGAAAGMLNALGGPAKANDRSGLHVPPEDAPHECTFMQWPVSKKVYRDPVFLEMVQQTIADIANTIAEFEPVIVLAAKADHRKSARMLSSDVELWNIPTEDLWCRDSGPLFAKSENGELVVSHIRFNGWGNKQSHKHDSAIAETVAQRLGLNVVPSGLSGEAGGIEHDGHGLLMAHESSWVNPNRNPGLTRRQIEKNLLSAYGAEHMIWAPGLKGGDITDYHIDSLARLTGPNRVLINLPDATSRNDPFHIAALKTYERLINQNLEIEVIPEPVKRRVKGYDFVASYVNYYVCNDAVITAQFGDDKADGIAREALARHYPGREVVMLNVDPLGEIGGGIHCATQQMPRA